MNVRLREIAAPFTVGAPTGARVRARLRVSAEDEVVLRAVGSHLGSLARHDLAARVREGRLGAQGKAVSRRERKRTLTAQSSSRWAGAITRTSEDHWGLAERNLRAQRSSLRASVRRIEARLAVPAGGRRGRLRGYPSQAERWGKLRRLQVLKARLRAVEQRIADGRVPVCRGGRDLLRKRHYLRAAGLTAGQWRGQWEAARLFLTADGEAGKTWGNETIRFHPGEGWLEIKLPAPLAQLAKAPHGRYRLSCPVAFAYRGDEVAAQAASGAVRYDIVFDPARGRWYLDASWRVPPCPAPGLPASQRDGRLCAAISQLIRIARGRGCRAIAIEDLHFAGAREQGRDGGRPSRGSRGRAFRRIISSIPTARFRGRLTQMAGNKGLTVIAVDPAYTSRWGGEHWLATLREYKAVTSGHHAAAVVIGRRAHGHKARRRAGVTRPGPADHGVRATPSAPAARRADRNGGTRQAPRQLHPAAQDRTGPPGHPPDQVTQDRSGPPTGQYSQLLIV